jgi:hypothetical protein
MESRFPFSSLPVNSDSGRRRESDVHKSLVPHALRPSVRRSTVHNGTLFAPLIAALINQIKKTRPTVSRCVM